MSRLLLHHPPPPPPRTANRRPRSTVAAAAAFKTSSILASRSMYPIRASFSAAHGLSRRRWPGTTVICMANPRRVKMVAKQIRRELADMLLTDTVLKCAVLPEAALGADRYLSSLATISDVEVSGDLQVVKVYVSVFGDERGREVAIAGLKSKTKYVRGKLGQRMKLRLTPEIRFIEDDSIERGSRVIAILDRIKNEKKIAESQNEEQVSSDLPEDEMDWKDVDPDEGIIYVE